MREGQDSTELEAVADGPAVVVGRLGVLEFRRMLPTLYTALLRWSSFIKLLTIRITVVHDVQENSML